MPRIDCKVTVKEKTLEATENPRRGPHTRLLTSYRDRPDMGFVVQGNLPSECRQAARDEAIRRHGHTHYVLAANLSHPRGATVSLIVEPRRA